MLRPHDRCACEGSTKRNRWQPFVRLMMRLSRVSIGVPSLCTDDARSESRDSLDAFSASALPDFDPTDWSSAENGTMRLSDSLFVMSCRCLFHFFNLLATLAVGYYKTSKNNRASLVACLTLCVTRTGRGLRDFAGCSPLNATSDIAFGHAQTLGRIQQLQDFGATSIHGCRATHSPFVLATSVYASNHDFRPSPYTQPATLDTGRVANAYPGGSHTR